MTAALTFVAFPPDLLEEVIEKQPAAVRAVLLWNARAIRGALQRLGREALSDAVVNDVSATFVEAVGQLVRVHGVNLAELGALPMRDTVSDRVRAVAGALDDGGACEALLWTWQQIDALVDRFASQMPPDVAAQLSALGEEDVRSVLATDGGHFIRAEVLVLAVLEAHEDGVALEVQRELTWRAFEEMCAADDALAAEGFIIRGRTGEDVTSVLRAADSLRSSLTLKDVTRLRAARVGDLR